MASYARELGALTRVMELFVAQEKRTAQRAEVDMTATRCLVFMAIAERNGEVTASELCTKFNIGTSVMSRHILAMSEWEKPGRPGMNLVEMRIDPVDTRRKLLFLTTAGREFAERLLGTITNKADVRIEPKGPDALIQKRFQEAAKRS